jgi:hypothetical protein
VAPTLKQGENVIQLQVFALNWQAADLADAFVSGINRLAIYHFHEWCLLQASSRSVAGHAASTATILFALILDELCEGLLGAAPATPFGDGRAILWLHRGTSYVPGAMLPAVDAAREHVYAL